MRTWLQPLVALQSWLKPALHRRTSPSAWHVHVPHSLPQLTQDLLHAPRCGKLWHFNPTLLHEGRAVNFTFPAAGQVGQSVKHSPCQGRVPATAFSPILSQIRILLFPPTSQISQLQPKPFPGPFLSAQLDKCVLVHACIHTHSCPCSGQELTERDAIHHPKRSSTRISAPK